MLSTTAQAQTRSIPQDDIATYNKLTQEINDIGKEIEKILQLPDPKTESLKLQLEAQIYEYERPRDEYDGLSYFGYVRRMIQATKNEKLIEAQAYDRLVRFMQLRSDEVAAYSQALAPAPVPWIIIIVIVIVVLVIAGLAFYFIWRLIRSRRGKNTSSSSSSKRRKEQPHPQQHPQPYPHQHPQKHQHPQQHPHLHPHLDPQKHQHQHPQQHQHLHPHLQQHQHQHQHQHQQQKHRHPEGYMNYRSNYVDRLSSPVILEERKSLFSQRQHLSMIKVMVPSSVATPSNEHDDRNLPNFFPNETPMMEERPVTTPTSSSTLPPDLCESRNRNSSNGTNASSVFSDSSSRSGRSTTIMRDPSIFENSELRASALYNCYDDNDDVV